MKDTKQNRSYYNDAIMHITPLVMYMAPMKQRAVIEVLVRKSLGITFDFTDRKHFDDGAVDIKVLFHFDVGLPVVLEFIMDLAVFKNIRELLCDAVLSYTYAGSENGPSPAGLTLDCGKGVTADNIRTLEIMSCADMGNTLEVQYDQVITDIDMTTSHVITERLIGVTFLQDDTE